MWYIIINTTPIRNIYCRLCFRDAIKVARNWSHKIYGKPHITKKIRHTDRVVRFNFKDYY